MTIENPNYKEQVLFENAEEAGMSVINYVNQSVQDDPNFYRWLFGEAAAEYNDFVCPNTKEFNLFCEDLMAQDV